MERGEKSAPGLPPGEIASVMARTVQIERSSEPPRSVSPSKGFAGSNPAHVDGAWKPRTVAGKVLVERHPSQTLVLLRAIRDGFQDWRVST